MSAFLAIVAYRCLVVAVSGLAIYLGYRLFFVVLERQGEISIKTGSKYEIRMRDVAPGTFFALFGAVVLAVSLLKPLTFQDSDRTRFTAAPSTADVSTSNPASDF